MFDLSQNQKKPILANGPRIQGHMIILLFILIETFPYTYNKMWTTVFLNTKAKPSKETKEQMGFLTALFAYLYGMAESFMFGSFYFRK